MTGKSDADRYDALLLEFIRRRTILVLPESDAQTTYQIGWDLVRSKLS